MSTMSVVDPLVLDQPLVGSAGGTLRELAAAGPVLLVLLRHTG